MALAILSLVAGCSDKAEIPPPGLRVVKAMTAGVTTQSHTRTYGGDVHARNETNASFRVAGKLAERLVDVGALVKGGQPLARIDVTDLALRAREANAQLAQAIADEQRYRDLHSKSFVSQAALDTRETAKQAARAQASLARNQAAYSTLTADHDGVVAEVLAQQGQVVAAGQAVLRLAWDGEREIAISIPEEAVADIKVGSPAEITLWTAPGKKWRGKVRELAPIADRATRTYAARVTILDAVQAPLGMSANVTFIAPGSDTLVVPMSGVFQKGDQPAVWVISKDSKLSLRPVRIAAYGDEGVHISEGIAPGERIVTAGVNRLHEGEQVRIANGSAAVH